MPRKQPERFEVILIAYGFEPDVERYSSKSSTYRTFTHQKTGCKVVVYTNGYADGKVFQCAYHNNASLVTESTYPPGRKRFMSRRKLECWLWYELERKPR